MFHCSNMKNIIVFLLAVMKIDTCLSTEETNLTSDETADGDVKYKLYNSNFVDGIYVNLTEKDCLSELFKNVACVFLTHGWQSDASQPAVMGPVDAFQEYYDFNLIAVDWENLSNNILYIPSTLAITEVGNAVCQLLIKLDSLGICKIEETYAIGHSLGAHLMGVLGSCVQENAGKQLARITGLDPAGPSFSGILRPEEQILDSSDANFVDVVHTDNLIGTGRAVGHVDFRPNGGRAIQPGCNPLKVACSHQRSYWYFTESIRNTSAFPSVECDSYENFKSGSCDDNAVLHMGLAAERDFVSSQAPQGVYYLETNPESPFSK